MIIGILGDAGAGKDTVADHLVSKYGFRKHQIAKKLYQQVAQTYRVSVESLANRQHKDTDIDEMSLIYCMDPAFVGFMLNKGFEMGQKLSPRTVLEQWGDYRREQNRFYFLAPILDAVRAEPWFNHVVSDVRVGLEYESLSDMGAAFWRVYCREKQISRSHATGTALAKARVDARLPNNGSLSQLFDMVDALLLSEELMTA